MPFTFLWKSRKPAANVLLHAVAFLGVLLAAYWLRGKSLQADAVLQGYLEVITGLLAFVFAAVTLVRFQGTQDRRRPCNLMPFLGTIRACVKLSHSPEDGDLGLAYEFLQLSWICFENGGFVEFAPIRHVTPRPRHGNCLISQGSLLLGGGNGASET